MKPPSRAVFAALALLAAVTGVLRFTARTDLDPAAATTLYELVRE